MTGYRDSYRDGPRRDMDRYGGRDRYDDRGGRDYDRGHYKQIILELPSSLQCDDYNSGICSQATISRIGSGRRASAAGTVGMTTTEEAGTAMKTDTTDEMTGPGSSRHYSG